MAQHLVIADSCVLIKETDFLLMKLEYKINNVNQNADYADGKDKRG